jgi:hypothetical protein
MLAIGVLPALVLSEFIFFLSVSLTDNLAHSSVCGMFALCEWQSHIDNFFQYLNQLRGMRLMRYRHHRLNKWVIPYPRCIPAALAYWTYVMHIDN